MSNPERRNDLGSKILSAVLIFLVTSLMGFLFTITYSQTQKNSEAIQTNTVLLCKHSTCIDNITSTLTEIKDGQRRMSDKIDKILQGLK